MTQLDAKYLKDFWVEETPTGTVNGSNVTFTISATPKESDTLSVFKNGLFMTLGSDYTLSGTTITFATAPATASILVASYVKKQGV